MSQEYTLVTTGYVPQNQTNQTKKASILLLHHVAMTCVSVTEIQLLFSQESVMFYAI